VIRRAKLREFRVVLYYVGLVVLSLAGLMLIPLFTALVRAEWGVAVDFIISAGIAATIGFLLLLQSPPGSKDLSWTLGMAAAALSWLVGMLVAAVPYYLSGHWGSYLDACFDVMSGFTTTGLVLVQDLDHLADGVNMWRHLITWLGGQGMVVLALTFFVRGLPGAFKWYVGEAKDERLRPNVIHTARAIWYISVTYLVVGTVVLWTVLMAEGLPPDRGLLHSIWLFMAAWSTGGFAPMSQNILYYHSLALEIATMVFFIIGSFNFNLHWAVWRQDPREIYRNLETVTFLTTTTLFTALASWELARTGVYPTAVTLFRKGYYSLISAHTTTGFMTTYARQFALEWGPLAMVAITAAMLFGGSASSTAGGFKAVRVGLAAKSILADIRKYLAPESAVVSEKFHMTRDAVLEDRLSRTALTIIVLYVLAWASLVAVTSVYAPRYGWSMPAMMFEAASAMGNVGLSAGITQPAMPAVVKVAYISGMWLGRLEFFSIFVLIGWLVRGWTSR